MSRIAKTVLTLAGTLVLMAVIAVVSTPDTSSAAAPSGAYSLQEGAHYFNGNVNVDGTLTQAGAANYTAGLTVTGGVVNLNASSNNAVNIGSGTTTSTVTVGGTGTQTVSVCNGAGIKTCNFGSATSTSATAINAGTGDLTITSTDDVTINGGSAGSLINLGTNVDGNVFHIGDNDTAADTGTIGSPLDTWSIAGVSVTAGSTGGASALTLQSGTGDVNVTSTDDINIGANASATDIDIGNETLASSLDLKFGTGNFTLEGPAAGTMLIGDAAQTGTISLGASTGDMTLNLGTGTGAHTINLGTGGTGADVITIGGNVGTVAIDSGDWDISTTGVMTGIGAITSNGLITGTAGAALSGATVDLNASSNFAANVCTGTSTGTVTIGSATTTQAIVIQSGTGDLTASSTDDLFLSATDTATLTSASTSLRNTATGNVVLEFSDFADSADDDMAHANIVVNCTDATSGAEDCDFSIGVAEAGAAAQTRFTIDADGGITVGSSNNNSVTLTTDSTGDAEVVLPDGSVSGTEILDGTINAADEAFAGRGQIVICGDLVTISNNTVYYGPDRAVTATAIGGMKCDVAAAGNTTESTADAKAFEAKAFHVRGMVCRTVDTNATVSFTLRASEAATTPSVTCSTADNELDCVADVQTTTAIASGSTVAIAAASAADVGTAAFVCVIDIAY